MSGVRWCWWCIPDAVPGRPGPPPADVVVMVEGVGETDDWGRRVGEVRVLEDEAERVGDMSRSG